MYVPLHDSGESDEFSLRAPSARRTKKKLAFFDVTISFGVVLFVTVLTQGWAALREASPLAIGLFGATALVTVLWWNNAYLIARSIPWNNNFAMTWKCIARVAIAMIVVTWLVAADASKVWLFLTIFSWFALMTLTRVIVGRNHEEDANPIRVIVAGNTGDALATRLALRSDPNGNYAVQGFVMDRLDDKVPPIVSQMALGSIDQLAHVVTRIGADLVVVCMGALDAERFAPVVRELNVLGVDVALSTGLSNVALRRVSLGHISGRPLVRVTPAPLSGWQLKTKRALDIMGAILLLGATGPIMLMAAIAIRIEDGGSAIFSQTRVGKDGEPFTIYKFRTMIDDAETMVIDLTNDHEGPVFKMRGDPRITRVGQVLRKTSMDELPQLFNILRGEMSLVGPRPLPVHEVEAAPVSFLDRQAVKPGLTGRWQVSGRSDTGFDELDELDRWYVDNWSLGQDLEILVKTVPAVLMARGAR